MQLAEIKVSYINQSPNRQKVVHSKAIYEAILPIWNLDTIEYVEEAKIILLNRGQMKFWEYMNCLKEVSQAQ